MSATELPRVPQELQARDKEIAQLRAQQRATAQILRVISESPTDAQPVFDMIVENALQLCDGQFSGVFRFDGELVHLLAHKGLTAKGAKAYRQSFPRPPGRDSAIGRAILSRTTVQIPDVRVDPEYGLSALAQFGRMRCIVAVPMLRAGNPIGGIAVTRTVTGTFSDKQIELLKTFADQALIALDNARLFQALEMRNEDVTEALEQQTAASEILKVISSSPTDLQPVFDMIAHSAKRLCDGEFSVVFRFDGELLHLVANNGLTPEGLRTWTRTFPRRAGNDHAIGRAILSGDIGHIPDVEADPEYSYRALAKAVTYRSIVAIPILHESRPLGGIVVTRSATGFFPSKQVELLKTFADQAAIAIENVRLFQELQTRNREITEALEQQTATGNVLRVISSSPTDVQPVFEAIVGSAAHLCDAEFSAVARFDDGQLHLVALNNLSQQEVDAFNRLFPRPPDRGFIMGRAFVDGRPVHVEDVIQDPDYDPNTLQVLQNVTRYRTFLGVPILRDGIPIGVIGCARRQVRPFTDAQIALVMTFATQAVIAIENVRLFQELQTRNREISEALEQQTATTEVLEIISRSTFDLQPVLETLVENASKVCGADRGAIFRPDGDLYPVAAAYGASPEFREFLKQNPIRPGRGSVTGRVILERRTVHVPDVLADPEYTYVNQRVVNPHTTLGVPLLREGTLIGVITIWKEGKVSPFTERQIELVTAFAAQAVIAIENVRLFQELQTRNRETTEALEQQTATSEVLKVISSSPTDVQPVFEMIAERAARLCRGQFCVVNRFDGELIHLVSHYGIAGQQLDAYRQGYPRPAKMDSAVGRAIVTRDIAHIPDIEAEPGYKFTDFARAVNFRSIVAVPLLRDGNPVGSIAVSRSVAAPFPDEQIELVKTFADQAVIAIENVRLFQELDARTRQLTRSVEELKALGEIGQTISSSLDLETVLKTIVARAVELSKTDAGTIYEFDEAEKVFEPRANYGMSEEMVQALRGSRLRLGDQHSALSRAAAARSAVQISDLSKEPEHALPFLQRAGYRALLAVPLLREERIIGGLVVRRKAAGELPRETLELLQTFATQSALAIENARLFREIKEKSRELEVASQHKSHFVANMSHELRTPLNAIIGYSEMLEEEAEDVGQESFLPDLKNIRIAGKHLLGLINEILDLSKIEAGKMELFLEQFDLDTLVRDVVATVQPLVETNANTLQVDCIAGLGTMTADLTKVRQSLFNLLSNACKFTNQGTISLKVRRESVDDDQWISFRVQDTGIGMTQEQMAKLFQAFSQADASTTRQFGGTGLGLAISRQFCQMMGGDITVDSALGNGSTFTIKLPRVVVDGDTMEAPDAETPRVQALPVSEQAPTVLVIDDDPAVHDLMQRFLNREGLRMIAATDGKEGLRLAKAEHPDAITLDVLMPGMDGWSVLAALKADGTVADIPVIMITIADQKHGGFALGAADYLTKPIEWKRLTAILHHYMPADTACRVLVVEDDTRTRKMLRRRLEKQGWPVTEAENGRVALEYLAETIPDVILLDLMMPEMDGFQFLDRVRADERWRSIPVIVITAKDLSAQDRRNLSGYVEKILEKGTYSSEALLSEVCDLLSARIHPPPQRGTEAR